MSHFPSPDLVKGVRNEPYLLKSQVGLYVKDPYFSKTWVSQGMTDKPLLFKPRMSQDVGGEGGGEWRERERGWRERERGTDRQTDRGER